MQYFTYRLQLHFLFSLKVCGSKTDDFEVEVSWIKYLRAIISYNSGLLEILLRTIDDKVNKTKFLYSQVHNLVKEVHTCYK